VTTSCQTAEDIARRTGQCSPIACRSRLTSGAFLDTVGVPESMRTKELSVTSRLNPYISFSDNAREAMEFYRDVFGGELVMSTFGEMGGAAPGEENKIMHAQLETPSGFTLMASDTPAGMDRREGSSISVSLSGDDEELRGYFEKLSAGGTVTMPLEKQIWGDEFGMCVDPYGVAWMVNVSQPTG
jgi:PhnB protein